MLFPTITCVDNFFDDPDAIVKKSKQFEYKINRLSAGSRTLPLHTQDFAFFDWVNSKIASIFYPNFSDNISFNASTHFDRVKKSDHDNWVHNDADTKYAAIIFLNKEGTAGTSIYKKKDFHHGLIKKSANLKYEYFEKGHKMTKKELDQVKKQKEFNNSNFEKTFHFEGLYNRLIVFDANCFHSFNSMTENQKKERLTLISFVHDIKIEKNGQGNFIEFPIPKMRTI
jgi:hypothetical protein